MTNLCTLIPAIFLASCAPPAGDVVAYKDPAIASYASRFVTEAWQRGRNTDLSKLFMDFRTLSDQRRAGECVRVSGRGIIIRMNSTWWPLHLNDQERENVVFHELGHCVLNREHSSGIDVELGIPASVMYPSPLPPGVYTRFRKYYVDELFRGSK